MSTVDTPRKKEKKEKKRKRQSATATEVTETTSPVVTKSKKVRTEPPTPSSSTHPITNVISQTEATPANPFSLLTARLYLPISPLYNAAPFLSLETDHLDPLILTYYPPFAGVILAYRNIHFLETGARMAADSPFAYTWVKVDFLVWTPKKGDLMEGWVNLASQSHVGVLVLNTFNASIPRKGILEGWTWSDEVKPVKVPGDEKPKRTKKTTITTEGGEEVEGVQAEVGEGEEEEVEEEEEEEEMGGWLDAQGRHIDGLVRFRVEGVKADGHIITIEGSMVDVEQPDEAVVPDEGDRVFTEMPLRPSKTPPEPMAAPETEAEKPLDAEGDEQKKSKKEKKHKKDKKAKESS